MRYFFLAVPLATGGVKMTAIATGFDLAGVLALAEHMNAITPLFFDVLSEVEAIVVRSCNRNNEA